MTQLRLSPWFNNFLRISGWFLECIQCIKIREDVKNVRKVVKYWIWELLEIEIWSEQWEEKLIPETPTRSASDPISGLTALCAYLFYSYLFLSQITIIFPEKKQPECPLNKRFSRTLYTNKPRQPSWLGFLDLDTLSFNISTTSAKY